MSSVGMLALFYLLLMGMAVALGVLLIVFSRRRGTDYPSCGRCGYDVSRSVGSVTRCPECGCDFTEVGILPPRRKRNPFMVWAGVAIIVLATGCTGSSLLLARAQASQAARARQAAIAQQAAAQQAAAQAAAAQQGSGEEDASSSEESTTESQRAQSPTEDDKD